MNNLYSDICVKCMTSQYNIIYLYESQYNIIYLYELCFFFFFNDDFKLNKTSESSLKLKLSERAFTFLGGVLVFSI